MNGEEWSAVLSQTRLPIALVDLAAFDRNIQKVAEIVRQSESSLTVRVATKSIRVPKLIARVLAFGPPYQGLMAFSVEEAAFLADQGLDDFLIAYPTYQDSDCLLLRQLHDRGVQVSIVVDHPAPP